MLSAVLLAGWAANGVLASVVVSPDQVVAGKLQTFTTGVSNEKDAATVGLRLIIPGELEHVSPNVKPGWQVTIAKTGEGEMAKVTELNWTGGTIPADQSDEFVFSAQLPAKEGTLQWKAYQTFKDGTVVSWDQAPNDSGTKAYSQTKIVHETNQQSAATSQMMTLWLSGLAVVIAIAAVLIGRANR